MSERIILPTDPEAATYKDNISGWVSSNGFFYGNDERSARYAGSTHTICASCGEPVKKALSLCNRCRERHAAEKYARREKAEWDETGMLYSDVADRFFSSWDDVADWSHDQGLKIEDLRLVICDPEYMQSVDTDYWSHNMPDDWDGELPAEVMSALNNLNEALRKHGPVSWSPGKNAVILCSSITAEPCSVATVAKPC